MAIRANLKSKPMSETPHGFPTLMHGVVPQIGIFINKVETYRMVFSSKAAHLLERRFWSADAKFLKDMKTAIKLGGPLKSRLAIYAADPLVAAKTTFIAGAIISGGLATFQDYPLYKNNQIPGGYFAADVAAEMVIGGLSGTLGTGIGLFIGSRIPNPYISSFIALATSAIAGIISGYALETAKISVFDYLWSECQNALVPEKIETSGS